MDRATVTGLLLGMGVLVAALLLGNVPLETLLRPEALLTVLGGTLTAVLISFSPKTLSQALGGVGRCFSQEAYTTAECLNYLMDVASFARTKGILALQPMLKEVDIPFLQKGLTLVVDNRSERFIRESLSTEIELSFRDEMEEARVLESAGGFAPTMGIIGTIIGLIHVVQSFQNPVALGQGVAGAFTASLYGVALSNLFLLPFAGKIRQRAREEWFRKTLLLEGILSIHSGEHPMLMEEKLETYVSRVSTRPREMGAPESPESVDRLPAGVF